MRSAFLAVCLFATGPVNPVKDAESLIERGHPWRATQTLAPALLTPRGRTPNALIVAARAAAGWGGWTEVDRLLTGQKWIDSRFGGEGRELLARSAFDRNADSEALVHSSSAARDTKATATRGVRLVLLARALERNNMFDSAAATYMRAASDLPVIRDWLLLRAAGNSSDSLVRAKRYGAVSVAVARPRRAWTEAEARERFSDAAGAAARYAALGAMVPALRLRLSVAPDSATRDAILAQLLAFIRTHAGSSDARSAVDVIDKGFASLSPPAELIVARSTGVSGPVSRAVTAFGRALADPALVSPADRLLYAQTLMRVGRTRDGLAQFDLVTGPLAGSAAYQRVRAQLSSASATAVRDGLRDIVTRFPQDTSASSSALYLLADLSTDDGNDAAARESYQRLYTSYPTSNRNATARFRAAIIAFANGAAAVAAREFDSLAVLMPRSDEATAARYWSGRAWAAAGNASLQRERWQEIAAQPFASYYGVLAARGLGEKPWTPPERADVFPRVAEVDRAIARLRWLERAGMDVEARFEYDALEAEAPASPDRLLATAHAFALSGQAPRAIRLAQKLIDGGQRDARAYRLLFPVIDRDELVRNAALWKLDPALVAGLIRQESAFYPRALSSANARGLMQVLPSVGAEIARGLGFPTWNSALLFDADANLQLGTAHFASFVKQYGALTRVLAAYNAGGSRVTRWASKAGSDDPELFAERIPFVETRDYVRVVQRNAEMYRALYDWK